jgi:hypothetical protein
MDRKALRRAYKETPPPMGVYAVRNVTSGRLLLGASPDVRARLNRERFQLEYGSHPSPTLQADWNALGPEAFSFDVLDTLERADEPGADPTEDLDELLRLWRDKLQIDDRTYPAR